MSTESTVDRLIEPALTIGEIARRLNVPVHRVRYVIDTRGVRALATAGTARIFSQSALDFIRGELRRIAQERGATL